MTTDERSAKRLPHFLVGKIISFNQMTNKTNTMQQRCGSVIDSFLLVSQNIDCSGVGGCRHFLVGVLVNLLQIYLNSWLRFCNVRHVV